MTPLIDIVFLLLIYFMLASSFVERGEMEIQLPKAALSQARAERPVSIRITREGRLFLGAEEVVPARLKARLDAFPGEAKRRGIEIAADRRAPVETLVLAMDAAKEAGFATAAVTTLRVRENSSVPGP